MRVALLLMCVSALSACVHSGGNSSAVVQKTLIDTAFVYDSYEDSRYAADMRKRAEQAAAEAEMVKAAERELSAVEGETAEQSASQDEAPAVEKWIAGKGASLRTTLEAWAFANDWTLSWLPESDYVLQEGAVFEGDLATVIPQFVDSLPGWVPIHVTINVANSPKSIVVSKIGESHK